MTRTLIRDVIAATAAEFGLTPDHLTGPNKNRHIARPRQIAYMLARDLTGKRIADIARAFNRTWWTVADGLPRARELAADDDREYAAKARAIRDRLARQRLDTRAEIAPPIRERRIFTLAEDCNR